MALSGQGQLWDCMVVLGRLWTLGGPWELRDILGQDSIVEEGSLRLEGFAQRS